LPTIAVGNDLKYMINAKKPYLSSGLVITVFPSLFCDSVKVFMNGFIKSMGIGKIVVELFSVAISLSVCK
jgi:hypothetical protein